MDKLKELRLHMGFTQQQLSEKSGLSRAYISLIEKGEKGKAPSLETISKLSQALQTTPEYLLYGTEPATLPAGAIPLVSIPVLGMTEAGGWAEMIEYVDYETIEVPTKHKHCFAVRVQGESMHPTIPEGSAVVVNPHDTDLIHNKVYLFRDGDSSTIKRLSIDGSVHTLKPDNPDYKPRPAPKDGGVIGRIIAFYGEL